LKAALVLLTLMMGCVSEVKISRMAPRTATECTGYDGGCQAGEDCCSGECLVSSRICIAPGCDPHLCPGQKAVCKDGDRFGYTVKCYPLDDYYQ
jgi:hypothetical protein